MTNNYFLKGQRFVQSILNENINTMVDNRENPNFQKQSNPAKIKLRESYDRALRKLDTQQFDPNRILRMKRHGIY